MAIARLSANNSKQIKLIESNLTFYKFFFSSLERISNANRMKQLDLDGIEAHQKIFWVAN